MRFKKTRKGLIKNVRRYKERIFRKKSVSKKLLGKLKFVKKFIHN